MAPSAIESLDEPDLVARQFTWLMGGTTAAFISAGLIFLFSGNLIVGILLLLVAIPLYLTTRRLGEGVNTTVRLDLQGIQRMGKYAWSFGWDEIEYAAIHPYDSTQVLVVIPKEPVKHWSRTWRMKEQVLTEDLGMLPEGGYVVPVFEELAWDMEHYIAGHLPGHPGFDASRLRLPDRLMRGQYDVDTDEVERSTLGRTAKERAAARRVARASKPLLTSTPDPVAHRQALSHFGLAFLAIILAVAVWYTWENLAGTVALGLVAAFLAYRGYSAYAARDSILLINADGLRRAGPWGWQQEWKTIDSAEVEPFRDRYYVVVIRKDEHAGYHRSATALSGHPFPGNALITPIATEEADEVRNALNLFRP